jgi:hypothetical protein
MMLDFKDDDNDIIPESAAAAAAATGERKALVGEQSPSDLLLSPSHKRKYAFLSNAVTSLINNIKVSSMSVVGGQSP